MLIGSARHGVIMPSMPLELGITPAQLALAWLLQRSPVMLPIPGTSSLAHLEENMASTKIQLAPAEWKTIEAAVERA